MIIDINYILKIFLVFFLGFISPVLAQTQSPLSQIPYSTQKILSQAQKSGFTQNIIEANGFYVLVLEKIRITDQNAAPSPLVIYIEGDGRSWLTKHRLSHNPTPRQPLALELALKDPRENVIYIARPCQYVMGRKRTVGHCEAKYWSSHRFAEEMIDTMDQVINKIIENIHYYNNINNNLNLKNNKNINQKIEIIGYSGGAAIAILLAARRDDIIKLRSVAGDLDHAWMAHYHHTTPTPESLNPINYINNSNIINQKISQIYYYGTHDKTVPPELITHFIETIENNKSNYIKIIPVNATHHERWAESWVGLLGEGNYL